MENKKRRILWIVLGAAAGLAVVVPLILFIAFYCFMALVFPVVRQEVRRVPSQDKRVEAVMYIIDAGATTREQHAVYLVQPGRKPDFGSDEPVFQAYYPGRVRLCWIWPNLLEIKYETGEVFHFKKCWRHKKMGGGQYMVEIRLERLGSILPQPGSASPSVTPLVSP